ncbi:MAG TPA: hypothetical protein VKP64_06705 [Mycobacteriales bacterium]|nr:hypothetical protein [Mycobacteriales bacterium]
MLRRLPSGRYQASWTGPDGRRRSAATTFATKTEAARWLAAIETDVLRGVWVDDGLAEVAFSDYTQRWLRDHPRLGPRWRGDLRAQPPAAPAAARRPAAAAADAGGRP